MGRTTKSSRTPRSAIRPGTGRVGSERLRVGLHIGQLLQPIPGGIGRVTELLCDELPARADVVAFSSFPRGARRALVSRFDAAVEFRSLGPGAPRWHYALWNRYRRPIDLHVDVCHAPSLAIPPTVAPLVVSINDLAFLRRRAAFTPHGVRFHEKGLAIARREAAAIIVPSAFTRDELVREGFDRERIHLVPLAIRAPRPSATRGACEQLRRRGVPAAPAPFILSAGTIEPRKDHATLVAAFERVRAHRPDLSLVVAGATGWLSPQAVHDLERPGVVVLGHVSDAELDELYRRAAVAVSASLYEGFGLTVLEAMARERAVVASDIPAHAELVGETARLYPPGDVDALAAQIDELMDDPVARDDLGRAARERARRFDVATTVAGHLAVYELAALSGG